MKHPNELISEELSINTLVELSSAFEGIASMKIAKIKNKVLISTKFFDELWNIYRQLRVDNLFKYGRGADTEGVIDKELFIIITSEGGLSGDIDLKLVKTMLAQYDPNKNDVIVIGHHGAIQLNQRKVAFKKYFRLPEQDEHINVMPIVKEVQKYRSTKVYYQEYITLMNQTVKEITLIKAVQQKSEDTKENEEIISEENYIFEPTSYAVIAHLERSMMHIALSQLIFSSKLAQFASRFRAMSASHQKADEQRDQVHLEINRAKRAIKDERLKEILNSLHKISRAAKV
jgi:F-type H+-transporting ATPase subunit gamma